MSVVTDLMQAVVDANRREIDGRTLTEPRLIVAGKQGTTYGVDVDIGQTRLNPATGQTEAAILSNVPLANGDRSLLYAAVGAAVRLRRSTSGQWEVSGYSKRAPGTFFRVPVVLGALGDGPVPITQYEAEDISIQVRPLTYGEIAELGVYGQTPYGASGWFRDGVLVEVK